MLVKLEDKWVDIAQVEYALGLDPDETGVGGLTHFRGESGFIRFDTAKGDPILVNSRFVSELRADGEEGTEITTTRGETISIRGAADWVGEVVNRTRRYVGLVA